MKIVSLALAVLASASTVVDATRLAGKYTSDVKFTSKLLSKARKYDRTTDSIVVRRVEEAAAAEEEEFQLTGYHSIIFKSCETLSVQADFGDADGEDDTPYKIQQMYDQGAVRAQHSYILFDVCLTDYCYQSNGSYRTTYVVDMADFIQTFAEFIPTKQATYCQGCQEQSAYCVSVFNGTEYGAAAAEGNGRFLQDNQGVVEYIDCNRCQAYGCYADDGAEDGGDNNAFLQWIQEMSECARDDENPYYFNGAAVSMGFMCNADGSGVEIATFLDEDCVLYTNQIAFGNIMSQQDYEYWYQSRQSIEYMFNTGFSCYDPQVTYTNPYDYQEGDDANAEEQNADGEQAEAQAPEASEWCRAIMEGGQMELTPMSDCGGDQGGRRRQLDQEAEAAEEENQGYSTTSYTLAEEYINDGYAVCMALNGFGGQGEHLYDKSGSGSMYQYSSNKKKTSSSDWQGHLDKQYSKSSGKKTGLIVFFVLFATAGLAAGGFFWYKHKQADSKKEPMLDTTNDGTIA